MLVSGALALVGGDHVPPNSGLVGVAHHLGGDGVLFNAGFLESERVGDVVTFRLCVRRVGRRHHSENKSEIHSSSLSLEDTSANKERSLRKIEKTNPHCFTLSYSALSSASFSFRYVFSCWFSTCFFAKSCHLCKRLICIFKIQISHWL